MALDRVCEVDLRTTILLPLCGLLAGCSSGYSRGEMDAALRAAKPVYVSSELSVEEIERIKPQLKLPARIAIAPPVQTRHGSWGNNSLNTWTSEEVAVIESWREPLRAAGVAEDVVVLPSSLVKDCQNRDREPTRYGPPPAGTSRGGISWDTSGWE